MYYTETTNFKSKTTKEHFEDIDTMWTDICSLKNDIVSLSKSANREINSLKKKCSQAAKGIGFIESDFAPSRYRRYMEGFA